MKKKKLLFVITKSEWGGAGRYVFDLAQAIKDRYDVVVLLGGKEGVLGQKLEAEGIRTISAGSLARDIRAHKDTAAFFELLAVLRKEKPDIVHVNSSKAGGLGALAARLSGVPRIVYTVHGWAYNEPVPAFSKLFRWTASLATAVLCHKVITVSQFDGMHSPLGLSTTTIHNGISAPQFLAEDEARTRLASLAGVSENEFFIGTIAELNKNKGIDILIRAFAETENAHLLIIGEGEDRGKLELLISEHGLEKRAHLLGFVENAATLMKGFGILVLPSRKEGLPYVLLEAGSAGLPVIASIVGGVPEIIDDQLSGVLVPPYDTEALAAALDELSESPATRARYGAALKEKTEHNFTLQEMVHKTIQIYEF